MASQDAAPGAVSGGLRGGLTIAGDVSSIGLPPHILQLLEHEGVRTLAEWRELGRRRFAIFGVTHKTIELLDAAAKKAPP